MKLLVLSIFLIGGYACSYTSVNQSLPPSPSGTAEPSYEFDRKKARELSDSIVDALIKNDRPALRSKMVKEARDYYDQAAFDDIIDKMFDSFGAPQEVKFKKAEQGRKWGSGGFDRPMLKHWYAVRTTKADYEKLNYVFVEIVPDEGGYASSGVSIVNFPMGIPDDMK